MPYGAGLAWNDLGVCYEKQEKHVEALRAFERARYFDERYGNFDGLAKKNYEALLNFITTKQLSIPKDKKVRSKYKWFWDYGTWILFTIVELLIFLFFIYKTENLRVAIFSSVVAFVIVKFPKITEFNLFGSGAKTETPDLEQRGTMEQDYPGTLPK